MANPPPRADTYGVILPKNPCFRVNFQLFPTCVGMNRLSAISAISAAPIPYMRGDEPRTQVLVQISKEYIILF